MIRAIRTLAEAVGGRQGLRVYVTLEDEHPRRRPTSALPPVTRGAAWARPPSRLA
jgi:hypothetical protein